MLRGKGNRLLDRIENPQEQLAAMVDELDEQVAKLRKAVAVPLAQAKRLRLDIENALTRAADWESRALLALEDGNEELAREALLKKEELEERALGAQRDWEVQKATADKLQESLRATKQKVEEAKRKYALLVARHESAVAQRKIAELTAGTAESPEQMMDRLSDKILTLEAETAIRLEMSEEDLGNDLEAKFHELERRKRGDQALAQLKASVVEQKRLPPASRVEELKAKLDED